MYNLFGCMGNTETFTVAVSIDRSALKYRFFTYIQDGKPYNGNAAQNNASYAGYRTEYINQGVNNIVNCSTRFSSAVKHISMNNFERANINLSFGNMDVYFDGCNIPSGHAIIDINGKFGNLVLYIPSGWNVDVQTGTMAGRVKERNRPNVSANSPVVTLNGVMQFGSVEIQYI